MAYALILAPRMAFHFSLDYASFDLRNLGWVLLRI